MKSSKSFKQMWGVACKSMWIEVAALRHLETSLRATYASRESGQVLTDWIYAPECKRRIDDSTHDFILASIEELVSGVASSRIVLLSAAFEVFFEEFLTGYLTARAKYSTAGKLNKDGNLVSGQTFSERGPVARIEKFAQLTGAKIASIRDDLPVLADVYQLRNLVAHDGGIVAARAAEGVKSVCLVAGARLSLSPTKVVSVLAPPVVRIVDALASKVHA